MHKLLALSWLLALLGRLLVSLYWRLGPGLPAFLPGRVRALLAASATRADLIQIVTAGAGYFHLDLIERREMAIELVTDWLQQHRFDLTGHEVVLLVELLYGWLKRHQPERIAPLPIPWGERP